MCGAINGEAQSSHESRGQNSNALPSVLIELLSQSCLIPAMSSYLRNDSGKSCFNIPQRYLCGQVLLLNYFVTISLNSKNIW